MACKKKGKKESKEYTMKTLEKMAEERIAKLREEIIDAEVALKRAREYKDYDQILFPEMKKLAKQRYNIYMCKALGLNIQRERE